MATKLNGTIIETLTVQYRDDGGGVVGTVQQIQGDTVDESWTIEDGVGANKANSAFVSRRTLAPGVNETLDLQALVDEHGNTLNLNKIKYIKIKPLAANGSTITVGAAASNPWLGPLGTATSTSKINAGASWKHQDQTNGYAVSGTSKDLKVVNDDGSAAATYDIIILGER